MLPKIHKITPSPPARPIVSGSGGPTEKISKFMDDFIGPLHPSLRHILRTPPI